MRISGLPDAIRPTVGEAAGCVEHGALVGRTFSEGRYAEAERPLVGRVRMNVPPA
jgi:hypothetical protein